MRPALLAAALAMTAGCTPTSCDVQVDGEVKPPQPHQPGANAVHCEGVEGDAGMMGEPVHGLTADQVEDAIEPMLKALARCTSDQDSGKLALRVTAAHEGSPRYVEPIGEHAGTELSSCAAKTLCEMRLPPIDREISFGYNFEVADLQQLAVELERDAGAP